VRALERMQWILEYVLCSLVGTSRSVLVSTGIRMRLSPKGSLGL